MQSGGERPKARASAILIAALLPALLLAAGLTSAKGAQEKGVLRATLPNGLRVVIVRNTLAPVVTTVMNYKVGSNEAPEGFPGTAHAQEHMMFRGAPGLSANQLADITAAMGGESNADTTQDVTQYYFTVPVADLNVALHIASVRMSGVLDSEKLWNQERGAIEQEVAADMSNPEYVFYIKLLAAMFRGTPYAHDALGTRPSFNSGRRQPADDPGGSQNAVQQDSVQEASAQADLLLQLRQFADA
ncbi:MAG: insulinase family protein [Acidobacteriota bacterium]